MTRTWLALYVLASALCCARAIVEADGFRLALGVTIAIDAAGRPCR